MLQFFKDAGKLKRQDPIQALDGMWLKHRVSLEGILSMMAAEPGYIPTPEFITEKLGDCINYTLILEALIEERRSNTSVGFDLEIKDSTHISIKPPGAKETLGSASGAAASRDRGLLVVSFIKCPRCGGLNDMGTEQCTGCSENFTGEKGE